MRFLLLLGVGVGVALAAGCDDADIVDCGPAGYFVPHDDTEYCIYCDQRQDCTAEGQSPMPGPRGVTVCSTDTSGLPFEIENAAGWVCTQMGLGLHHSCIVDRTAQLVCFGANDLAQLGRGFPVADPPGPAPAPVVQDTSRGLIVSIGAGDDHSCGVDQFDGLSCWGSTSDAQASYYQIEDPPVVATANLVNHTIGWIEVDGGARHTCARSLDLAVYCFGANDRGQLGCGCDGEAQHEPQGAVVDEGGSELYVFKEISAGDDFTCGRIDGGAVKCWGDNTHGQLTRGTEVAFDSHALLVDLGEASATTLAAGGRHACVVVNEGAGVLCWGDNRAGQAVPGADPELRTPAMLTGLPALPVRQLAAGDSHSCALVGEQGDSTVYCWGDDSQGQLGRMEAGPAPAEIELPSGLRASRPQEISAGSFHTCARGFAVATSSELFACWGQNDSGQTTGATGTIVDLPALLSLPTR